MEGARWKTESCAKPFQFADLATVLQYNLLGAQVSIFQSDHSPLRVCCGFA